MYPPTTPPPDPTMNDRSPSPEIPQPVVYARLHHFRGKSSAAKEGKSKQVYNIDALQVVFGREESCDIRIYADNVSRKHCKIVIDLLTGKATLHVLSSHGLKLNRVPLAGGTVYVLQDDDIINVMERKFRFEYASGGYDDQDDSSLSSMNLASPSSKASSTFRPSLVQPIIPPSPAPRNFASPARKPSSGAPPTPLRHAPSTRMHLFPKDYASEEVRAALGDIGVEMEPANPQESGTDAYRETPGRKSRKEDFVYLEDREELDAEESKYALTAHGASIDHGTRPDSRSNANKPILSSFFSTPQPAKKITRVPRTSLAPRTRKQTEKPSNVASETGPKSTPALPQTPSSVPLPPSSETPYGSAPLTPAPSAPSIYPSLDQLSVYSAPQTPVPQTHPFMVYQTPRNVPLPDGGSIPYGSFVPQTPQSSTAWEIDPASMGDDTQQEGHVEDVEMEDVSEYESERYEELEQSRSPAPHLLALASAPMTPRNIPLPMGGETPYAGIPSTPVSAFGSSKPTSPEESTSSMPETPRAIRPLDGQVSLRRRLLLRSAHKVMQEQISRRDMRRTMGVGSGLIGTPMRPLTGANRSSMVHPMSQPMTPISESAFKNEVPQTPESVHKEEIHMTPSRVALPSPGGTQYEASFEEEADDEDAPVEYAEPLKDHDDFEGDDRSLAMYQTDAGEDGGEGEDEDAEGETDPEEEDAATSISPVSPFARRDDGASEQGIYFASVDGGDAVQFPSLSASQQLFQSNSIDNVSDDDDLVDQSLDIGPEMNDVSDEEDQSRQDEDDHRENDEVMRSEESGEEDKENEPLATSEDDQADEEDVVHQSSGIPASPSRAIRRPLVEEYYTPQPLNRKTDRRGIFGRKSLSSIGGPAIRGTPRSDLAPMKQAFARMSLSEREVAKQEAEDEEVKEESQPHTDDNRGLGTPVASRHPAMDVPSEDTVAVEAVTPLQGLKNKLADLRRRSTHVKAEEEEKPLNRRATFGVSVPETPNARETRFEQRGMNSAAPVRRFMPRLGRRTLSDEGERVRGVAGETAGTGSEEEDQAMHAGEYASDGADSDIDMRSEHQSQIEDEQDQPSEASATHSDGRQQDYEEETEEGEGEDNEDEPSVEEVVMPQVHTPASSQRQQKLDTASFPATPMLAGLREMLKTPKATPETPRFSGMKEMFTVKPEFATPEMSGIVDLFPEIQSTRHGGPAEATDKGRVPVKTTKLPTRSRATASTTTAVAQARSDARAAASRSRAKPDEEVAPSTLATTQTTAIRRARTAAAEITTSTAKPKATRARPVQVEMTASTSTDSSSVPVKKPTTRAARARTATAEPEEKPDVKSKSATRTVATRTLRAKSAVPEPAPVTEEDGEADPLDDITVPEPDPEEIKPARKVARTAATTRTATARPLATRSALPQPSQKDSAQPEKPKTRTRAAAGTSRLPKTSIETEEAAAAPKRATRAAAGSRLTAPTASSKARATPPPTAPAAAVRKTRAAATSVAAPEVAEPTGIPKRVTRARK